jgi:hypothetical protein
MNSLLSPKMANETETFELEVVGVHPIDHAYRVESILRDAPGICNVRAHPRDERIVITYDPSRTNPVAVHDHLMEHGYLTGW